MGQSSEAFSSFGKLALIVRALTTERVFPVELPHSDPYLPGLIASFHAGDAGTFSRTGDVTRWCTDGRRSWTVRAAAAKAQSIDRCEMAVMEWLLVGALGLLAILGRSLLLFVVATVVAVLIAALREIGLRRWRAMTRCLGEPLVHRLKARRLSLLLVLPTELGRKELEEFLESTVVPEYADRAGLVTCVRTMVLVRWHRAARVLDGRTVLVSIVSRPPVVGCVTYLGVIAAALTQFFDWSAPENLPLWLLACGLVEWGLGWLAALRVRRGELRRLQAMLR